MQQPGSEQQDEAAAQEAPSPIFGQQEQMAAQNTSSSSLEQQLAEAQQQQQDYLDALRRSQADFLNYKRRVAQEQAEACMAAQASLLETLLPVLDDLGRALEAAPPELAEQPWVQGIHLVAKRLVTTLQPLGIWQIGSPGEPFDPQWHEAIMTERRVDLPEGTVTQVTRPGYAFRARVLRPAQVVVAAPEPPAAAPSEG